MQNFKIHTIAATLPKLFIFPSDSSLLNFHEAPELVPAFRDLKAELEEIFKNPFENKALDLFDFISWLESKIENRAFAEVVREKAVSH